MFENFDPTRMSMGGPKLNRRSAIFGLGAALGSTAPVSYPGLWHEPGYPAAGRPAPPKK